MRCYNSIFLDSQFGTFSLGLGSPVWPSRIGLHVWDSGSACILKKYLIWYPCYILVVILLTLHIALLPEKILRNWFRLLGTGFGVFHHSVSHLSWGDDRAYVSPKKGERDV